MKKPPLSILMLAIGVALGVFVAKAMGPQRSEGAGTAASAGKDASGNPRSRPPARSHAAGRSGAGASAVASKGLTGLLNLTSEHWQAPQSSAFLLAIEALSPGELAGMIGELDGADPQDARKNKVRTALFARWAAIDPDGAWQAASGLTDKKQRSQAISNVLGEAARTDPHKARQMLMGIQEQQLKNEVLHAFLWNAAAEDPELALEVLQSESTPTNGYSHYHNVFSQWAKDDPDAALASLTQIKGSRQRHQALAAIVSTLALSDPQRAMDMLAELPNGKDRSTILSSFSSSWMSQDSEAAMAWIKTLPPSDQQKAMENGYWQLIREDPAKAAEIMTTLPATNRNSHYFSQLASEWAQHDVDAAKRWVDSLPAGRAREQAMQGMIQSIAQNDPAKAASMISPEDINGNNSHLVGTLLGQWVRTDQKAAMDWLGTLDLRGNNQQNAISQLMHSWADEDVAAASRYALGIEDEKSRKQAITPMVYAWAQNDPEAAKEWLVGNLDGDARNESFNQLIQNLSYHDHATALRYYQEATANLTPEQINKSFSGAASQLASAMAEFDPQAAGQWVLSMPEGETRANTLNNMVQNWVYNDIKGAAEFVNTLPAGKERDRAVEPLVYQLGDRDPESAFEWAASISDEKRRESMIQNTVNRWKQDDPAAARAAVSSADLGTEARARILKNLGK
jgi:hypothetical protein